MSGSIPSYVSKFCDEQTYFHASAIAQEHFYSVLLTKTDKGAVLTARYSPSGETPTLIRIDGAGRKFYCNCREFQKRVGYPSRMGFRLCKHLIRLITMVDKPTRRAIKLSGEWGLQRTAPPLEREMIATQAHGLIDQGRTLAALTETYFGIRTAALTDLDVASILNKADPDSIADQDLPEAMRFLRVALQHGFSRNVWHLAEKVFRRFVQSIDRFAPFDEVAPVALWLQRWGAAPDLQYTDARKLLLDELDKNRSSMTSSASWWLLFRAVSKAGTRPPDSCINAWNEAVDHMRLSLVHPDRINDAASLLHRFDIKIKDADESYTARYRASLRRARERRVAWLLRLARAHHLAPFLIIEANPYTSDQYVRVDAPENPTPLQEMMLNAIGIHGRYLSPKHLVENWPIVHRLCENEPDLGEKIKGTIEKTWPEAITADSSYQIPGPRKDLVGMVPAQSWVVRWSLSNPTLIANSPLVAHHRGGIYIPARTGFAYPEPFGLTLCTKKRAMGRRLFTLDVIRKLDSETALGLLADGVNWIGPVDDMIHLLGTDPAILAIADILSLPKKIRQGQEELLYSPWIQDQMFLGNYADKKTATLAISAKQKLWASLHQKDPAPKGADIGFLFAPGLNLVPNQQLWRELSSLAVRTNTAGEWMKQTIESICERLPMLDRPASPIQVRALVGTPLEMAIGPIVKRRKREMDALRLEVKDGFYDLKDVKKTVYGRMLLNNLGLLTRRKLRPAEASKLIKSLAALNPGVSGLPLFSH